MFRESIQVSPFFTPVFLHVLNASLDERGNGLKAVFFINVIYPFYNVDIEL